MTRLVALALFVAAIASAQTPRRIVSASPSITEMLYSLGLGDRVVGVTEYCHFPPEVRDKAKIGSYLNPSMETIVALQPDLAVVLEEHGALIDQLKRVNVPVLAVQHNDVAGIYASLQGIAVRTGVESAAAKRISEIKSGLAAVKAKAAGLPSRKTIFVIGRTPNTVRDLICVGRGSFLNELILIAGGRNVFANTVAFYPRVSREELLAGGAEVVMDMGDMSNTDGVTEQHRLSVVGLWRDAFPDMPAVREGRAYAVADDRFVVPGPRIAEAAQLFLEMIHPEAAKP